MYKINNIDELNHEKILKIIENFRCGELPQLTRYHDYYAGRQDILKKKYSDPTKPCNHIVKNYCYSIVNNYLGYIVGVPVTYTSHEDISSLLAVLNDNDVANADAELLRNALIYGVAYEVYYIDEAGKGRFKVLDSCECIPVYDDTLNENLLAIIRFFATNDGYAIEVYDKDNRTQYTADKELGKLKYIWKTPNRYNGVPFTVFNLNTDKESIFDKIMSMQDAYNELLSSEIDDFQAFVDAYLVLNGVSINEEEIKNMRENRILQSDEVGNFSFLTKNINDTQIENMLKNLNDSIHVIANSPDFNDEKFMASSGIAMRHKLLGFENASSAIIANMTKALNHRISLLAGLIELVNDSTVDDVNISFTRNLPKDEMETINAVNTLRGLVSDKTLLARLPFINDVDAEMAAIDQQKKENMNIYSFGGDLNE